MKTKNKILVMLEIAIVLCSVLFVALPVIAGDQNQTAQEVSASEVTTTASEDDFILEIYGNANEDDCIDMRDYTYAARIICWLEDETTFADANYDGRISVADMTQIGLMILGRESELTLIDTAERTVTVKKPLERIVVLFFSTIETLRALGVEKDIMVGVAAHPGMGIPDPMFFPEFLDVPSVGEAWNPDIEAILELDPDVILMHTSLGIPGFDILDEVQDACEVAGITVLRFNLNGIEYYPAMELGYVFGKVDEAKELIDFRKECLNSVKEKVEKISEAEKPTVYFESYLPYTAYGEYAYVEMSGGIDLFPDAVGEIDKEAVLEGNPDIIVKVVWCMDWKTSGYHLDVGDTADLEEIRDEIMSRPELQTVKAVEEGKVYIITSYLLTYMPNSGARGFLQPAYQAKWFHPTLFEDIDQKAIHQEYLTEFQGLDIDLDEKGVFVCPEPS